MKIIRCLVQPNQVDQLVNALMPTDIPSLTVTGGNSWRHQQAARQFVYRGREYAVKLSPESIVDITAPDHVVEDVVRIVTDTCGFGPDALSSRILIMPLDDRFLAGAGRRVA